MDAAIADVPALLGGELAADTHRPLLTFYDDATGERVELSAAALASWAGRTATLLTEGCGLGPGDRAAVLLPPHWQTAAVLLGAWAAGVAVAFRPAATAGLPALGPGNDEPYDATFVSARRLDDWLENVPAARHPFVLGLAPGAAPMAEVPAGYRDFLAEVGRYVGRLPAPAAVRGTDPATADGTSYRQWGSLAQDVAEHLDIRPGDRLLINTGAHEQPVTWLLAPLAARATVVLCANLDPTTLDARVVAEGVTRVL